MVRDRNAQRMIAQRLQPGERLVWYDFPAPFWRAAVQPLATGAITSFVLSNFLMRPPPELLAKFFVFGILAFVLGRSLSGAWQIWGTVYALSDRRAYIALGETGSLLTFDATAFAKMETRGTDTYGALLFDWAEDETGKAMFHHGFYGIREARRLEASIRETLAP